jgi:hypothetical protein
MRQNTRYTKALAVAVSLLLFMASLRVEGFSEEKIVWRQTNGPYGGSVSALVVNAAGHIFVGTPDSGVFRSTDDGGDDGTLPVAYFETERLSSCA